MASPIHDPESGERGSPRDDHGAGAGRPGGGPGHRRRRYAARALLLLAGAAALTALLFVVAHGSLTGAAALAATTATSPPSPTGSPMPNPSGSPPPAPSGSPMPVPSGSPMPAPSGSATAVPTASPSPSSSTETAVYTLSGGTAVKSRKTLSSSAQDSSAVRVMSGGKLALKRCVVKKTGGSSSLDNSSFYGLNAAVLVKESSKATLTNCVVNANASGANGVFATGSGAQITMTGGKVVCAGQGAHGLDATIGGKITAKNVTIATSGANAAALATDRGGGTIVVSGGSMTTTGQDSPGIYSTGVFTISGAKIVSTGSEAAVIEGANSIDLTDTSLSSSLAGKWGVMIYQSMSGDAQGTKGTFTMKGGSLAYTASDGPLFYVTNSTGVIDLSGVKVTAASGTLVKAAAGNWGTSGSNGGNVVLTASGQTLAGDLVADDVSSLALTLQSSSSLSGAIDAANTAKSVSLTLDGSSTWTVTADSHLTSLSDAAGISGTSITNITGNGHALYYDASASGSSSLGGKTYSLVGGGQLKPE